MYAHITFPVYSFQSFTYKIPKKLTNQINTGVCVKVSFRNKTTLGYVVQLSQEVSYKGKILPIDSIYLDDYCIEKELWQTLIWTKNYYQTLELIISGIHHLYPYLVVNEEGLKLQGVWHQNQTLSY